MSKRVFPASGFVVQITYRLIFCVVIAHMTGCMIGTTHVDTGDPFNEKRISAIQLDRTTRSELMNLLGPPTAVLRDGSKVTVSTVTASLSNGTEQLTFETAFLLFAGKHKPSPHHVVFYYQSFNTSHRGILVVGVVNDRTTIQRTRLWVLLNESRDVVADYVYRTD